MTPEEIKIITETASRITLEEFERLTAASVEKQSADRRKRARRLLRDYPYMKMHCKEAIYDSALAITTDDIIRDLMSMSESGSKIEVIAREAQRTQTILTHIDNCLDTFRQYCEQSKRPVMQRKWRVIKAKFLDDPQSSDDEIARMEGFSVQVVRQDVQDALDVLGVLFFGTSPAWR